MLFSIFCVLPVGVCVLLAVPGSGYKAYESKMVIFKAVHFIEAVVDICCWVDMTSQRIQTLDACNTNGF